MQNTNYEDPDYRIFSILLLLNLFHAQTYAIDDVPLGRETKLHALFK
jgi:hypothetical protein